MLTLAVTMLVAAPLSAADHTKILGYKFGESRVELAAIEAEIRGSKDVKTIETELLKALNSPKATFECKQFVCRMLRRIGTEASAPSLARLLTDEKLSNMARFAIQGMPGASVDTILRGALAKTTGSVRIGIIGTIAARGDAKSLPALARLAADKDADTARGAIAAIGKIGGTAAAKALDGAKIAKSLQTDADHAALSCAESLVESGDTKTAAAIYKKMFEADKSTAVRIAALGGIARTDKAAAGPILDKLLSGKNAAMQRVAATLINEVPGAEATKLFASKLPGLPANVQVIVITAFASRGDKGASSAVTVAAASQDAAVRTAALKALGALGDASSVSILVAALPSGPAEMSLTNLSGDGVGPAIIKTLDTDNAATRASMVKILGARAEKDATATILKIAGSDTDSTVRRAAFKALGGLAGQGEMPKIASMLVATENASDRAGLANTILQVSERCPDADKRSAPVIAVLGKADDQAKSILLVVLSRLAGDKAYAAIKSQLASGSDDVKKASVRALAAWPDATPADTLLSVATTDSDATRKILAMRGYISVITIPGDKAPTAAECKAKAVLLAKGLKVAGPGEKKQILAALTNFPCAEGLAVVKGCAGDKSLANEARLAVSKIKWALARPSAKVSASCGAETAALAIDGVRKTFWTTGRVMTAGDSFTLTLPAADTIAGVTLDGGGNANDYPRQYELFLSTDGKNWGTAVAKAKGTRGITTISFTAKSAVAVKIVQTRKIAANDRRHSKNWSIAEITVSFE